MTTTGSSRVQWIREVGPLLWPDPERILWKPPRTPVRPGEREFALFPSARDPRLVLPVASRQVTAAVLRRWSAHGSAARRMGGAALAASVAAGAGRLTLRGRLRVVGDGPRPGGIEAHLEDVLGQAVRPVLLVTRPRANRKPVMELVDSRGRPVAYVKVGVDPLTRALVVREAAALRRIASAGLRAVRVPEVIDHSVWEGLDVLVLSPLPLQDADSTTDPALLSRGMAEVAGMAGLDERPLAGSDYRTELGAALARLPDPHRAALTRALELTDDFGRERTLAFGAWHGDWATWNSASLGDRLLVWDWERYAVGVPLGYDVVHHALHKLVLDPGRDTRALVAACPAAVAPLLRQVGVQAEVASLTTVLYLLDIAARYLGDGQEGASELGSVLAGLVEGTLQAASDLPQDSVSSGGAA